MSSLDNDIKTLSELHHALVNKMQQSNFEEQFSRVKGLATLEISVLSILSRKPDILMKEIVEELQIPKSTLTNVVDRLENHGFIYRVISKKDRRSFTLELTEEGKLAQEEHLKLERFIYLKILNVFDSEIERHTLLEILEKIVTKL